MRTIALACLLPLVACHIRMGADPAMYPPARRAAGTTAYATMRSGAIQGELLEVRDTALVLRTADRIVLLLTAQAQHLDFEDMRRNRRVNDSLTGTDRERLRLLSRYPQGIPPAALTELLSHRGQTALVIVNE